MPILAEERATETELQEDTDAASAYETAINTHSVHHAEPGDSQHDSRHIHGGAAQTTMLDSCGETYLAFAHGAAHTIQVEL